MKKLLSILCAACAVVFFVSCNKNIKPGPEPEDYFNGHEYVDLELPSGILWATCNVGATKPEEYGLYYGWGMTEPYDTTKASDYATYFAKIGG
ncbi:MAG: hypothetical protein HUJ98_09880, partial [Bacteroidaceae bacterium]|nr:hypothetical protein [Bacteroidaceae bacterium]